VGQQGDQSEELPQRAAARLRHPHGGHFGILATGVDNLTIDNLRIDTNRDGMDVDCCRTCASPIAMSISLG